jgi:hypothetical protein
MADVTVTPKMLQNAKALLEARRKPVTADTLAQQIRETSGREVSADTLLRACTEFLETAGRAGQMLTHRGDLVRPTHDGRPFGQDGSVAGAQGESISLARSALPPAEARAEIRARFDELAASRPDGKLTAAELHQKRVELLDTYGLIRPDGTLDHDEFHASIVLNASNASEPEWKKDYEVVTTFIDEIEHRITPKEVADFAPAIHENGYWRDRKLEIETQEVKSGEQLLLGMVPSFEKGAAEDKFLAFLTPEGRAKYETRYDKPGGYKILLSDLKPDQWLQFFAEFGPQKSQDSLKAFLLPDGKPNPKINPAKLQLFNANAGSWEAMLADAKHFKNPDERVGAMRQNQKAAMASTFALTRMSEPLASSQMDYATAVVWRYKGHWSGENGYKEVYQVSTGYFSRDFDADRLKDGPIWRAVLDRQLELAGVRNPSERFLQVVVNRATNESKLAFISSFDAMRDQIAAVRAGIAKDMAADPARMARLALVSHDLGYWPGVQKSINDPASGAFGRAPDLEGEKLALFRALLTEDGRKIYDNRFGAPAGYKVLGKHIADKAAFVAFMNKELGFEKTCAIGDKEQVFNANYGTWKDLEKDIPKFDALCGQGARLKVMMTNQEANILMTRMLATTDSFLSGMQMSHAMAVLWRYVVGDYQGEFAFDGKDRFGRPDPEGWRGGSAQVRVNYYDREFAPERSKDYEMWSSLLLEMAKAEGLAPAEGFKKEILLRSTNESELAWLSTYRPIVRKHEEISKTISDADLNRFAGPVHDNGYWVAEKKKIADPSNPFLGSHVDVEGKIERYLSPAALEVWNKRYEPETIARKELPPGVKRLGLKGYQLTPAIFRDDKAMVDFFRSVGKNEEAIKAARGGGVILNENAMSYADAMKEARHFKEPGQRETTIKNNQKAAIASGLVLADLDLTTEEMAYLTAVLWRYSGHYEGESGYAKQWQVSADYLMGLDRAERTKDVAIQLAVYDVLGKKPKQSEPFVVDTAIPNNELGRNGLPMRSNPADVDLHVGDRVFLKIDGKWYPGQVTDYRGDGMIDGTLDENMRRGNQYWQVDGYMVRTDKRVPGVYLPPNMFVSLGQLAHEAKADPADRRIVKAKTLRAAD